MNEALVPLKPSRRAAACLLLARLLLAESPASRPLSIASLCAVTNYSEEELIATVKAVATVALGRNYLRLSPFIQRKYDTDALRHINRHPSLTSDWMRHLMWYGSLDGSVPEEAHVEQVSYL